VGRVINQIVGMADMFGQFGPSPAPARKYQGFNTKPAGPEEPKEQEKPINWKEVKFDAAAAIVRGVVRAASLDCSALLSTATRERPADPSSHL
jgi:hypothetical protein